MSAFIDLDEEFSLFYYEQEVTFQDILENMEKKGFSFMYGTLSPVLEKAKENNSIYLKIKNLDNLGNPIMSPSKFN